MPTLKNGKRAKWLTEREPFQRRKASNQTFYNSQQWRTTRKAYITKFPLCVECEKKDIIKAGAVVDHIKPINEGGDKFNPANLQTLCHYHHNIKSGKEAHK